ncbi:MAG TPA: caspase family protein [Chthoniobacterales bacterium]
MKKGISLHLGLNYVDPKHYGGWNGELFACEADANDMAALAESRGFETQTLLRECVTAKAVKQAILSAAKKLKKGDTFFFSYSGHGGQVPDRNGDEGRFGDTRDAMDETWCLFDRQMVDDELAALYARFKAGVRIIVLSDSCHSGTVVRALGEPIKARVRLLPPAKAAEVYRENQAIYDAIQQGVTGLEQQTIKATVLLISGCQDNQLSRDGDLNGLFTGTLKDVWRNGAFQGGYRHFRDAIVAKMPSDQIPNYFVIGAQNKAFESEQPFTISVDAHKPGANVKAEAEPVAGANTPIEFVLRELDIMGLNEPKPSTNTQSFFAEFEKQDRELGLDFTRADAFVDHFCKAFEGVELRKNDLIKGRYATVQSIVDLCLIAPSRPVTH